MSGMDDRRKSLEEEYFHRKNQEAIEKLREKLKVSEAAKAAGTSTMQCPRCDGKLWKSRSIRAISAAACGSTPANSRN
jgi:hypothetical protein